MRNHWRAFDFARLEIAPHRHARLYQILLIESTGEQASFEGRTHALRTMRVVNVPMVQIHGFSSTRGTQGWVVTFTAEMLDEVLTPSEGLRRMLAHSLVLRGTPQIRTAMEQIFEDFADYPSPGPGVGQILTAPMLYQR